MIAFTVLVIDALIRNSADLSVSIVNEAEEGASEVTISILNTAGSTLLFYENTEMTGKIEYLTEDGWTEYCDVYYTDGNLEAFSQQYGGVFAELEPGEDWKISLPEEKVVDMKDGTYRIKMAYITEKQYSSFLNNEFNKYNTSVPIDESIDVSDSTGQIVSTATDVSDESAEEFLASEMCEVFIKTFEFNSPDDFVEEISIDDSQIEQNASEASIRIG